MGLGLRKIKPPTERGGILSRSFKKLPLWLWRQYLRLEGAAISRIKKYVIWWCNTPPGRWFGRTRLALWLKRTRLASWLRNLPADPRWITNTRISVPMWAAFFALLYYITKHSGQSGIIVNLGLSLMGSIIWYAINRWLFGDRKHSSAKTSFLSLLAWAASVGVHHGMFALVVTLAGVPLMVAKLLFGLLGIAESLLRYWFNDRKIFNGLLEAKTQ